MTDIIDATDISSLPIHKRMEMAMQEMFDRARDRNSEEWLLDRSMIGSRAAKIAARVAIAVAQLRHGPLASALRFLHASYSKLLELLRKCRILPPAVPVAAGVYGRAVGGVPVIVDDEGSCDKAFKAIPSPSSSPDILLKSVIDRDGDCYGLRCDRCPLFTGVIEDCSSRENVKVRAENILFDRMFIG